jgi:hypothetical protein
VDRVGELIAHLTRLPPSSTNSRPRRSPWVPDRWCQRHLILTRTNRNHGCGCWGGGTSAPVVTPLVADVVSGGLSMMLPVASAISFILVVAVPYQIAMMVSDVGATMFPCRRLVSAMSGRVDNSASPMMVVRRCWCRWRRRSQFIIQWRRQTSRVVPYELRHLPQLWLWSLVLLTWMPVANADAIAEIAHRAASGTKSPLYRSFRDTPTS